ncbi:MAG: fimbrial assembly protein [Betaproteobacteria bacterium]|nr:MAG: fimbrial assembly protein [Betaproteobacteria bacterium]TMH30934.1 MAG: fimbrial assembly protein [Betaproteobacteria bacterium]
MILVNLLPHREERRKRRKIAYFAGLGVAAGLGLAAVGLWYLVLLQLTSTQQVRNAFLNTEIKKLEVQIKDIATLKAEIESLKARQRAVEDLQTDRNTPVYVLNELVKQTPEGVYFNTVKQDGQVLSVNGTAQTNERVSELLRNTANNSEWLTRPELIEIRAASTGKEQKRVFDFSMRLNVKRPQDKAAAEAASAAKAGSAPAAVAAK